MRTRITILTGALLLVFSGAARAQQEQASQASATPTAAALPASTPSFAPKLGSVDFGFRAQDTTGDTARYQRYRDLRQGGYVDRFRFDKETDQWAFTAHPERQNPELGTVTKVIVGIFVALIAGYFLLIIGLLGLGAAMS